MTGPLVVTIGKTVANRAKLNWWESRALYGWTVLVPRTKDQAGEMSEKLVSHGALPIEVPTIAVEPPRSPAQMERAVKGLVDGRYPVGGVHLHQRGARGVGEVQRVRSGRPRVLRCEDRVRGPVHRRPGARIRYRAGTGAVG